MARLVLHIRNLQTGATEERTFDHSPVRIGRHQRNELALDFPFVSQWHGIFSFDGAGCTYLDQGSTNGSFLDGKRLVSAMSAPIGPENELRIGVLRLRAERQTGDAPRAPSLAARDPDMTIRATLPPGGPHASRASKSSTRPELDGAQPPADPGRAAGRPDVRALDWRAALPLPGSVLDDAFLERLSQALERLASIVDSQCTRDPDLAVALEKISPEGSGDALLSFLLDPNAQPGERAGRVRSALG